MFAIVANLNVRHYLFIQCNSEMRSQYTPNTRYAAAWQQAAEVTRSLLVDLAPVEGVIPAAVLPVGILFCERGRVCGSLLSPRRSLFCFPPLIVFRNLGIYTHCPPALGRNRLKDRLRGCLPPSSIHVCSEKEEERTLPTRIIVVILLLVGAV